MGCLFKCLDPGPPDESVRHFWHIQGLVLDAVTAQQQPSTSGASSGQSQQPHSPSADTLQVAEGQPGTAAGGRRGDKHKKDAKGGGGNQLVPRQTVQVGTFWQDLAKLELTLSFSPVEHRLLALKNAKGKLCLAQTLF